MTVNLRRGLALLLVASLIGCAIGTAAWVNLGVQLVTTVLPTIPTVIAAIGNLNGKTLSPEQSAKLNSVLSGVQDLLNQAKQSLDSYQQSDNPATITKIRDILNQVKIRLATVLVDVQITDPATSAKIQATVNSYVNLANNVLAILPIITNGKVQARKVNAQQAKEVTPEVWAGRFNAAVHAPTGNTAVDAAFSKVVAVPVKK